MLVLPYLKIVKAYVFLLSYCFSLCVFGKVWKMPKKSKYNAKPSLTYYVTLTHLNTTYKRNEHKGAFEITNTTFYGLKNPNNGTEVKGITVQELNEKMKSVQSIKGNLIVTAHHPDFKNLSFLRNVESIGFALGTIGDPSIIIENSSLEYIGLENLNVFYRGVKIQNNKNLCINESRSFWRKLAFGFVEINIKGNKPSEECPKCDKLCDTNDGCWGPGPGMCRKCKNVKNEYGICLEKCGEMEYAGMGGCKKCDEECQQGCIGPGLTRCIDCKHLRRDWFGKRECTKQCSINEYEVNKTCNRCHTNCVAGCSGPGENEGPGGCNICEKPVMEAVNVLGDVYSTLVHKTPCLKANDSCPNGYFQRTNILVGIKMRAQQYLGRHVCFSCHKYCSNCTSFGFNKNVCQLCIPKYEDCTCGFGFYYNEQSLLCEKCNIECNGCTGLGIDKCISCKGFRVYGQGKPSSNDSFQCVEKCPKSYTFYHPLYQNYCTAANFTNIPISGFAPAYGRIIFICLVCIFLIVFFVIVVFLARLWKLVVTYRNDLKVKQFLDDEKPLLPNNIAPNLSKLKIAKESELRKITILGAGAYGTVYRGIWLLEDGKTKIPVAIKVLNQGTNQNSTKEFLKEASIMSGFNHPNLIRLLAICVTSNVMIVTQLLPSGDLLHYLRKPQKNIKPKMLLDWGTQIAQGMCYLTDRRLVHRDLAARNVLIQSTHNVKVTDFGLARPLKMDQELYASRGGKLPVKWMSLEAIERGEFTHKSDVWSFGIVVWEMLTYGEEPYNNISFEGLVSFLNCGGRLSQPDTCSSDLYSLLATCWAEQPGHRPSFHELVDNFKAMTQEPNRFITVSSPDQNNDKEFFTTNFYHEIVDNSLKNVKEGSAKLHEYENIKNQMQKFNNHSNHQLIQSSIAHTYKNNPEKSNNLCRSQLSKFAILHSYINVSEPETV